MGFIKTMKQNWQALSTTDKVKLGIDVACGIGGGLLADKVYNRYVPKPNHPLARGLVKFTVDGMGMYGAAKASEQWKEGYDALVEIHRIRKARKAQKKEVKANG